MVNTSQLDIEEIITTVMDCASQVRKHLHAGYLEKIYEKALLIELKNAGLDAKCQVDLNVQYKGETIGTFTADIVVEDKLIVELKATQDISPAHEMQLVNYLTTTGKDDGLIINFGNENSIQFRRKYRVYRPKKNIKTYIKT